MPTGCFPSGSGFCNTCGVSPSTIIFGLLGLGFAVLLVAPRLHRRSNARSRLDAEHQRSKRVAAMQSSPSSVEVTVASQEQAIRGRDALLLRGIRTEILVRSTEVKLLTTRAELSSVEQVLTELG